MPWNNQVHAPQLLSPCPRARELQLVCALQQRSHRREKPEHHRYRVAPTGRNPGKAQAAARTQHSHKETQSKVLLRKLRNRL